MKSYKTLIAISMMLGASSSLCLAQDDAPQNWQASPIIELKPGKKVLKVADLKVPDDMTLGQLLNMFPELVSRDESTRIKSFDLQIDDVSTGTSKETLLTQLRASDIKEIELKINPNTSTQLNGQGGVINLKLNDGGNGFSGNALLDVSTEWSVTPAVKMSSNTDKLKMSWMISGQYYNVPNDASQTSKYNPDGTRVYEDANNNRKYGYEFGNFSLLYTPDPTNKLKVWAWEGYSNTNNDKLYDYDTGELAIIKRNDLSLSQAITVAAGSNYKHEFDWGRFETELVYQYDPAFNNSSTSIAYEDYNSKIEAYEDKNHPHNLSWFGKVKYLCIPTTPTQKCELTCGVNLKYMPKLYAFTDSLARGGSLWEIKSLSVDCNSLYVSPYAEIDTQFGLVFLKAGLRYQFYQYDIGQDGEEAFDLPQNKLTAFINFGWQVVPHHHLSFILDKSLKRPDNQQVYPGKFYAPELGSYITGNQKLLSEDIYTASADYQYDFYENGHTVLAGGGLRYNYIANAITLSKTAGEKYPTYVNDGYCNVINFNAMAMYGHGPFKVFFTGNLLQNWAYVGGQNNEYFSYNLSLNPMLFFPTGDWKVTGLFQYNSKVKTLTTELGDYFYSEVRLSKGIGKWNVYLRLTDNFHKVVYDRINGSDGSYTDRLYYLHFPGFGLGASLNF